MFFALEHTYSSVCPVGGGRPAFSQNCSARRRYWSSNFSSSQHVALSISIACDSLIPRSSDTSLALFHILHQSSFRSKHSTFPSPPFVPLGSHGFRHVNSHLSHSFLPSSSLACICCSSSHRFTFLRFHVALLPSIASIRPTPMRTTRNVDGLPFSFSFCPCFLRWGRLASFRSCWFEPSSPPRGNPHETKEKLGINGWYCSALTLVHSGSRQWEKILPSQVGGESLGRTQRVLKLTE